MSKLPRELENPIDKFFLEISEGLLHVFRKLNFTPNGLTSLSMITGIFAINNIYNNDYICAIVMIWVSYLFDCMDGMFARKYNMVSKFGDYYDHIKDIVVGIALLIVLMSKYSLHGKINLFILGILISGLTMIYVCNYEKYYRILTGKIETASLDFLSNRCSKYNSLDGIRGEIYKYRYVGFSMAYVAMTIILILLYVDFNLKNRYNK